jgi:hypothetical protein
MKLTATGGNPGKKLYSRAQYDNEDAPKQRHSVQRDVLNSNLLMASSEQNRNRTGDCRGPSRSREMYWAPYSSIGGILTW